MTYILPQTLIYQDVAPAAQAQTAPLRAHISGGNAQLIRYDDDETRELGSLGYYDKLIDTAYVWPHREAGAKVDQSYTKLFMRNALLRYAPNEDVAVIAGAKVAGIQNRVKATSFNFTTNGTYTRNAGLYDRDVRAGDIVKVVFADSSTTLWSSVKSIIGDTVAASIDAATADSANPTSVSSSATASQIVGPFNAVQCTASASTYSPVATGKVTETYTIIVTQSSTGGDLTTAKLRVISASGLDDSAEVTPAAENVLFQIGSNGAKIKFTSSGSNADASDSADDQGISATDLIAGMRFQAVIRASYTAATVASSGTYTGDTDLDYVVTVVEGKTFAGGSPKIFVTDTTGTDVSGPTEVPASGTSVAIGTRGARIAFTGTSLLFGNRYHVSCHAPGESNMRTLVLNHNIPSDVANTEPCEISLFILEPKLDVSKNRIGFAPLTNFSTSDTEITVAAGVVAYNSSWTDAGVPLPLDVESESSREYGKLYVEYRAWLPALANAITLIDDVGDLDAIPGILHPDNPLKWGAFKALENSGGMHVGVTAVTDPDDVDTWQDVLDTLDGRREAYGLVPLTRNRTVLDLFAAHVQSQSGAEQNRFRVLWVNLSGLPSVPVVHAGSTVAGHLEATTSDGELLLATVSDDTGTSGTQYTILRDANGNGNFITNGVRAGDIARLAFTGDGFGNVTYSEYVIDDVITEDEVRLVAGPSSPISVAAKCEIWRNLSANDEADAIGAIAGAWGNRRIRAVWPDRIESSGTLQEGYFVCCSLAGLRGGIMPHQGMTKLEVLGYTNVDRTVKKFSRAQLDRMAAAGVWIVTQDPDTGAIYTRHAVTTGDTNVINEREEMHTSNVDSVSFRILDTLDPYIGVTNVTDSTIELVDNAFRSLADVLKTEKFTPTLGGQIEDIENITVRRHLILQDRIAITFDPTWPYAFNNGEVHVIL